MNRRLADDAYRTAKELDALPRYMEGMPEEMKEKFALTLLISTLVIVFTTKVIQVVRT
jgi:hypothetical protein